jgi:hypothetical protein
MIKKRNHEGVIICDGEGKPYVYVDKPHDESECEHACEEALQMVLGHETVFEASDANETRKASAGYTSAYAAGYDNIDWEAKN